MRAAIKRYRYTGGKKEDREDRTEMKSFQLIESKAKAPGGGRRDVPP